MGYILKPGKGNLLYDESTGDVVGFVDADGGETFFARVDQSTGSLVGPDGTKYAALPVDENGNVIANVNHRTGTLAYLQSIVGGNGEIAKPTDASGLVVYDGVTVGGAYYGRGYAKRTIGTGIQHAGTLPNGGVSTPFNTYSLQARLGADAYVDAANSKVLLDTVNNYLDIDLVLKRGADNTGTYREVSFDVEISAGMWFSVYTWRFEVGANKPQFLPIRFVGGPTIGVAWRLSFKHDATAALPAGTVVLNGIVRYQ